jgi:hypothetical protein
VRENEIRPSVRRRERTFNRRTSRGPGWRLATLAAVSAVVLLPQTSSARVTLVDPPTVRYTIAGIDGSNGWYRGNTGGNYVVVHWIVTGEVTSTPGCEPAIQIPGPNPGTTKTCTAIGPGGTTEITTKVIRIDATPPSVAARASRGPDANGWYNHAVGIAFSGSDGMSGIAGCSAKTYAGPDSSRAVVPGTCTDRAGNSAGGSFALAYDSTPPQLKKLRAKHGDQAAIFKWQVSPDTQRVVITRTPGRKKRGASSTVYTGKASSFRDKGLHVGTHYRYTVSVFDAAANKVSRTVRMTGTGKLFAPAPGASVKRAPRLEWAAVRGATYYNVQIVRNGRIFSAWPKGTSLKLPRSWLYHGKRFRLHRGVYRWYVWPGLGTRSANKYGGMIGRSSFFFAG